VYCQSVQPFQLGGTTAVDPYWDSQNQQLDKDRIIRRPEID